MGLTSCSLNFLFQFFFTVLLSSNYKHYTNITTKVTYKFVLKRWLDTERWFIASTPLCVKLFVLFLSTPPLSLSVFLSLFLFLSLFFFFFISDAQHSLDLIELARHIPYMGEFKRINIIVVIKNIIIIHLTASINRVGIRRGEETDKLLQDNLLAVALRTSGIVVSVHSLILSNQCLHCRHRLCPPSTMSCMMVP